MTYQPIGGDEKSELYREVVLAYFRDLRPLLHLIYTRTMYRRKKLSTAFSDDIAYFSKDNDFVVASEKLQFGPGCLPELGTQVED